MNRAWIITLFCGATLVTLTLGLRQGFGLFLEPMTGDLGIGRETFAFAIAIQNLLWGASAPFFGAMSDRWGARKVIVLGALLYGGGLAWMGLSTGGGDIMIGQILVGLGMGSAGISVVLGIVGRAAPEHKRTFAIGIVTAGGSIGQFIMVPTEQMMISAFGWATALLLLGALAAIAIPAFSYGLKEDHQPGAATIDMDQTMGDALREALSHRGFLLLTSGFFVCGFQVVFIATHLPAFLSDRGVGPAIASWALALVGLFNILGALGAGWIGSRAPKRISLAWFYLLRSVIIAAFILTPVSATSALVFGAAIGLFWLGTIPLTSGMIATFFGARYLSMLYGIVFVSHQVGSFLGAWYGGYLYDTTGNYETMWWLTIASGVVAAVLHMLIREQPVERIVRASES